MSRRNSSFSAAGSRRPWWLILVIAAITWAYQHFSKPPQRERPAQRPRTERRAPREPQREPKRSDRKAPATQPGQEGGQAFTDVVERVKDGDTVVLKRQGDARLIGVDCPEKSQDGGPEAKAFTERALLGKTVGVELCAKRPTDRYGRSLAFIYLGDSMGRKVLFNSELVRQGYARVYSVRPCTIDEAAWGALYEEARASRRGLFGTLGNVPNAAAYRQRPRRGTSSTN
ncbi:MAG TPA: thermonuclease family protein [Abditibacteriaceae bacterium]|nr:thermonuclease family protein [Abditibacteriaceae bacterium]